MRESQLYIPSISYPPSRKKIMHDPLPETVEHLNDLPLYTKVPIQSAAVNKVLPLVSTGYYFCQAIVVKSSTASGVGLAHVLNGDLPNDYVEVMRSSGLTGNLDAVVVLCHINKKKTDTFVNRCYLAGLNIQNVIEIPMKENDEAPQTDIIVNPIRKRINILTEGRVALTRCFF